MKTVEQFMNEKGMKTLGPFIESSNEKKTLFFSFKDDTLLVSSKCDMSKPLFVTKVSKDITNEETGEVTRVVTPNLFNLVNSDVKITNIIISI